MTTTGRRPLDGVLVLDLGQIYNGPYCGLLLGFMGARVLKIEPPEGDVVRRRKRNVEPYPLVMLNSNKESVVLDFKRPDGKALFSALGAFMDGDGGVPERTGNRHPAMAIAPYNVYPTKDGYVAIFTASERHWHSIARVLGREDLLANPDFASTPSRAARVEEI